VVLQNGAACAFPLQTDSAYLTLKRANEEVTAHQQNIAGASRQKHVARHPQSCYRRCTVLACYGKSHSMFQPKLPLDCADKGLRFEREKIEGVVQNDGIHIKWMKIVFFQKPVDGLFCHVKR
jgi:hypothetical protein